MLPWWNGKIQWIKHSRRATINTRLKGSLFFWGREFSAEGEDGKHHLQCSLMLSQLQCPQRLEEATSRHLWSLSRSCVPHAPKWEWTRRAQCDALGKERGKEGGQQDRQAILLSSCSMYLMSSVSLHSKSLSGTHIWGNPTQHRE